MYEIKIVLKMSNLAFRKIVKRPCKYHLRYNIHYYETIILWNNTSNISEKKSTTSFRVR